MLDSRAKGAIRPKTGKSDALATNLTDTATFPALNTLLMSTPHKNKTLATFLAFVFGGIGLHRFYLRGSVDRLGLAHLCALPIAGLIYGLQPDANVFFKVLPIVLSCIVGFVEALVIGTTPDEKWDASFNPSSGKTTDTNWMVPLMLVAIMLVGATTVIATLARLFDLLYTGGTYG